MFPATISNSKLTTFMECPYKFYRNYIAELEIVRETNKDLNFGQAFAAALEEYRISVYSRKESYERSMDNALRKMYSVFDSNYTGEEQKGINSCINILELYTKKFQDDWLKPMINAAEEPSIEHSFSVEMDIKHPETKDPILFTGRFDMIGIDKNENEWIVDEKTTGYRNYQPEQYSMSGQLLGYMAAMQQYGRKPIGFIVREALVQKTQQEINEYSYMRVQHKINYYWDALHQWVEIMLHHYSKKLWPKVLSYNCKRCLFRTHCNIDLAMEVK